MSKDLILIVDDEPHIIDLIKLTLGDEYDFLVAEEGKEAVALAREKHPKLILLDIMMPNLDGYEVCKILRQDPTTKDIVIAIVSAKKEDQDIIQGVDVGAVAYITKPFNPYDLQEKVKELLSISS